jgi:hypothetical protein
MQLWIDAERSPGVTIMSCGVTGIALPQSNSAQPPQKTRRSTRDQTYNIGSIDIPVRAAVFAAEAIVTHDEVGICGDFDLPAPQLPGVSVRAIGQVRLVQSPVIHENLAIQELNAVLRQSNDTFDHDFTPRSIAHNNQIPPLEIAEIGQPGVDQAMIPGSQSRHHALAFDDRRRNDETMNEEESNRGPQSKTDEGIALARFVFGWAQAQPPGIDPFALLARDFHARLYILPSNITAIPRNSRRQAEE